MSYYGNFGMEPTRAGRGVPVRIGDAERDGAITALGEHFAAGRLSREELDERVEQAMSARFDADLTPLLADLPAPAPAQPRKAPPVPPAVQLVWALMPMLLVGVVVVALVTSTPWILWMMFWIFIMGGFGSRHAQVAYQRSHHRPR